MTTPKLIKTPTLQAGPWLDRIVWNELGLVPVIAQEASSGDVLMMAWMNQEALLQTLQKGEAVYWSRSRNKLWHKVKSLATFRPYVRSVWIATAILFCSLLIRRVVLPAILADTVVSLMNGTRSPVTGSIQ